MMLKPADNYFLRQDEPNKSCLLFLRDYIMSRHEYVTEVWSYSMPFYCLKGKRFCYLWVHKKYHMPYLGIVEGRLVQDADLISEKRSRMKILMVDPVVDVPVKKIRNILEQAIALCAAP